MPRAATRRPPRAGTNRAMTAPLIDAPGVRDFAPPARLVAGRRARFRGSSCRCAARCKFNDCRHFEEPGCAVRAAVPQRRIVAAALRKLPPTAAAVRETRDLSGPARYGSVAAREGVRQRAAVDILEFAADRDSVGDARRLDAASQREFTEVMGRGLALGGGIGGEYDLAHFAVAEQRARTRPGPARPDRCRRAATDDP